MAAGVRVLRLLEYTYPDQETADADMAHWGVAANGSHEGGARISDDTRPLGSRSSRYLIRSAIIQQPWSGADDAATSD